MISSQARGGNHPPAVLALALPAISTLDFFVMCTSPYSILLYSISSYSILLSYFLALILFTISVLREFYLYILSLCIFAVYFMKYILPPLLYEKLIKLVFNFQLCSCFICCCDCFNCFSISFVLYCCLNVLKVSQYLCCHCLIFGNK